jgi:hypothetical protein
MKVVIIGALASALGLGVASYASAANGAAVTEQKTTDAVPTKTMMLGTVHIPRTVRADDQVLKAGTYAIRSKGEPLKPATGETPNLEQWVEFLQAGKVKGTAVASIVPLDQIHQVAEERIPSVGHARVDVLRGNDYLRVWINRGGNSYLIHLPTGTS